MARRADELVALVETTADVDVVLASAALSRGWGGAPVTVSDDVRLLAARHPLLDRQTAVPIDLDLGALRAVVISGPNTGGKTVALKTLGLAALLHQCGLRPPAQTASLPVFDSVLADIGDRQSIEMSLSTFSGHLSTLVEILGSATERSLVLLDEVAAGTDPEEGSALAQALVARLARQARLTVVTTHYPELKEWASATGDVANAATSFDPDTGQPLYRVDLGRPGTSHALRIAERLGLDAGVVADARSRVAPERLRAAELLAEAQSAERAAAELRTEAEDALRRARERESELQREVERVRASEDRARAEAIAAAERDLAAARSELAELREQLRNARRVRRQPEQDRALGAASERAVRAERALGDLSAPLPVTAPLGVGDPVESDLGVRGTITSIRGAQPRSSFASPHSCSVPATERITCSGRPARKRGASAHSGGFSARSAPSSSCW